MADETPQDTTAPDTQDEAKQGSFLQNAEQTVKDDFDKVEDKVESFVHDAKADLKSDEQDVKADEVEVKDEVKAEEALASDAIHHPSDAPADVKQGAENAKNDAEEVAQDVRDEAQKIAEQLKADFEKAQAAGPGHELTSNETPQAWANRINQPQESTNLPVAPVGPGPVPTQAQVAADEITAQRQAEVEQAQAATAASQTHLTPVDGEVTNDAVPDTHASTGNTTVIEPESDEDVQKAQAENAAAHGETEQPA